MRKYPGTY